MKNKKKKGERLSSEELALRAEQFLKGKELNPNGSELFEKALRKAVSTKQRGSK